MSDDVWRPSADNVNLIRRAELLAAIRAFMAERGVLEVDTPLLSRAAPSERGLTSFAVGDAGYLTPSPEHALKRLLAADAGPIYQLGHVFRAGEVGRWHNPEFSMLEWYRPHAEMTTVVDETAGLIVQVAGVEPAGTLRYRDVFQHYAGTDPVAAESSDLAECAIWHGVAPDGGGNPEDRAFWLDLLMSMVVQPELGHAGPVCVTHFPIDDAVLVEADPDDVRRALRFEFYWRGVELANGAQELLDVDIARERMQRETRSRRAAGEPAAPIDEALLAAMRDGLPRCAGVALGVDRLLALMLGCESLAEVIAFDWLRR